MRTSARADYAIQVLLKLAADPTRPITCEAVASTQDIPARFMRDLRQAGLVRGQGGYRLGRAAAEITGRDTTGRDTTGRDTTGRDTTGRDTTGRDTTGRNTVDGEFLSVRGAPRPAPSCHGTAAGMAPFRSGLDALLRATADLLTGAAPARVAA
ncbi:Rrf2 family transcriptional regulator [Amycolatopsis sp. NPDC051128]|uniref:RrF2 family transcriptional regulator n=1 Tax=Amycolatopsis sp. NPDC051128 TaxID=3155412 RepID=UPI0034224C16